MAVEINCATGVETPFTPPPLSLEDRKAAMILAINDKRDAIFIAGFTVSGTGTDLDGETLQTRDEGDKVNWLTSQAAYSAAVAQGAGAVSGATFRTTSNATVTLTYLQGLTVLLSMAAWGKDIMGNSWTLKDAVADSADEEALDEIDIGVGWP